MVWEDVVFRENIPMDHMILNGGSSDGMQIKYFKNHYWYKTDAFGEEGMIEYLVSGILQFSDLCKKEYVVYDMGFINDKKGCRSRNFLEENQVFITFNRLHKNTNGVGMNEAVNRLTKLQDKTDYVVKYINEVCNIDITDYLKKIFTLDYIILNEDRHFNNLGVIFDGDGLYHPAPIFDNGKSLFCGNYSVKDNLSLEENYKRVVCQPFGFSHKKLYDYFGSGFNIDAKSAVLWLGKQPKSRERDILIDRLKNYL